MVASGASPSKPWDFSLALQFSKSFNDFNKSNAAPATPPPTPPSDDSYDVFALGDDICITPTKKVFSKQRQHSDSKDPALQPASLGDFAKLWQTLGIAPPDPHTPAVENSTGSLPKKDDYASDGASYGHTRGEIQPPDPLSDDNDGSAEDSSNPPAATAPLTKTQRKKANRKARKIQEALDRERNNVSASESEADAPVRQTPAQAVSAYRLLFNATPPSAQGTPTKSLLHTYHMSSEQPFTNGGSVMGAPDTTNQAVNAVAQAMASMNQRTAPSTPSPMPRIVAPHQKADRSVPPFVQSSSNANPNQPSQGGQQANATFFQARTLPPGWAQYSNPTDPELMLGGNHAISNQQLNNSGMATPTGRTVGPPAVQSNQFPKQHIPDQLSGRRMPPGHLPGRTAAPTPANANTNANMPVAAASARPHTSTRRQKPVIAPKTMRSADDRNWALLRKLIDAFPQDRKNLTSPMGRANHNKDPKGIHVFVDASNIFIGFMDELKHARGIDRTTHVEQPDLSFDSLALLMERRRPTARRVLAGSHPQPNGTTPPRVVAFETAEAIGYECNILEKVLKARKLTERKKFFNELDALRLGRTPKGPPPCNTVNLGAGPGSKLINGNGSGSDSETSAPQYEPAAWVEQGVDELLHYKMLQSVVDYDEPGTMVLASGDAAAAEYSGGFMETAQKALLKGWTVELVTWSRGLNKLYRDPQWLRTWGDKFKIVYLDDFAEELLDM